MRRWTKYAVVRRGQPAVAAARDADGFFSQMGGYLVDDSYESKSAFFARHLQSDPRLLAYDNYLRGRVAKGEKILSVASGRCVNELHLMATVGCDIVCSDLKAPPCLDATKSLFAEFTFNALDVLRDHPPDDYDAVLSLSLIYAFDDAQLRQFFTFVAHALRPNGRLLLDLAGAPDNTLGWVLHDLFLPAEAVLHAGYLTLRQREPYQVQATNHGYRRTLQDVLRIASQAGLALVDVYNDGFGIDMRRGVLLNRLAATKFGARSLDWAGRHLPYVRMAQLVRLPDHQVSLRSRPSWRRPAST